MTAPVTSSSSLTSSVQCVHAFPSRRQDISKFQIHKTDPIPLPPQANEASFPFFLSLSKVISRERNRTNDQVFAAATTTKNVFTPVPPRTALKEGRREGAEHHVFRDLLF